MGYYPSWCGCLFISVTMECHICLWHRFVPDAPTKDTPAARKQMRRWWRCNRRNFK